MSLSLPAAIARVALVLAGTMGSNVSLTSPQPRPTTSERKPYGSITLLEMILSSKWSVVVAKVRGFSKLRHDMKLLLDRLLSGSLRYKNVSS